MTPIRRIGTDAFLMFLFLLFQVIVLSITRLSIAALTLSVTVTLNIAITDRRYGMVHLSVVIGMLTLPVLLAQIIFQTGTPMTDITEVFRDWCVYVFRLLTAAFIARLYLHLRGTSGLQRGLQGFTFFLPRRAAQTIVLVTGSALYLIPIVTKHFRQAFQIANIRFGGSRRGRLREKARIIGAVMAHLSLLPQRRAEGMVIRGMVD